MITTEYNPSPIEVRFVEVLCELKEEIDKKFPDLEILNIECNTQLDNPTVDFYVKDKDGDNHEILLKIIQKPDKVN